MLIATKTGELILLLDLTLTPLFHAFLVKVSSNYHGINNYGFQVWI